MSRTGAKKAMMIKIEPRRIFSTIVKIIFLVNYALVTIFFLVYLNRHDTGVIDYGGWRSMAIGGVVIGLIVLLLIDWIHQWRVFQFQSKLLFIIQHIVLSCIFLAGSFSLGCAIEVVVEVHSITGIISILPLLFVIPLMAAFYFLMMIPFGAYLGFTNGLLMLFIRVFHAPLDNLD
jgi:hypothetical protein